MVVGVGCVWGGKGKGRVKRGCVLVGDGMDGMEEEKGRREDRKRG